MFTTFSTANPEGDQQQAATTTPINNSSPISHMTSNNLLSTSDSIDSSTKTSPSTTVMSSSSISSSSSPSHNMELNKSFSHITKPATNSEDLVKLNQQFITASSTNDILLRNKMMNSQLVSPPNMYLYQQQQQAKYIQPNAQQQVLHQPMIHSYLPAVIPSQQTPSVSSHNELILKTWRDLNRNKIYFKPY